MRAWELLKTDKQFLHFNISRSLLLSSALALPYIAILGRKHSGANLGSLGILVLISGIATMVASPFGVNMLIILAVMLCEIVD